MSSALSPTRKILRCAADFSTSPRGGGKTHPFHLPLAGRSKREAFRVGGQPLNFRLDSNRIKNSSPQPLTSKTQFLHPRDARIRLHVSPKSRPRGGLGASSSPPAGTPGGEGGRFFEEQLSCRPVRRSSQSEGGTLQGGRPARQPQRLQARRLWRQAPCGQTRHAHLYAGGRRVLRRDFAVVQCAHRSCRNRPAHCHEVAALAARDRLGLDGGR